MACRSPGALCLGRTGIPCIGAEKRGYVTQLMKEVAMRPLRGLSASMFCLLHQATTIWIGTVRRGREEEFQRLGLGVTLYYIDWSYQLTLKMTVESSINYRLVLKLDNP